jgi:hypothetical protein
VEEKIEFFSKTDASKTEASKTNASKTPPLAPAVRRKVRNATKYISSSDSILEFCYDDPSLGEMGGVFNRLIENRKNHTVLTEKPENFLGIREEAKAEYELKTSLDSQETPFTVLIMTRRTPKNSASLLLYLQSLTVAPKLVIWESPDAQKDYEQNRALHLACKALGMKASMLGYENVYHREGVIRHNLVNGEPIYVPNPPPPRLMHMFTAVGVIALILFLVWYSSRYFFKSITPTTKSLANKPT